MKFAYRIAMLISDVQYYVSFRDRKAVRDNLKVVLRENECVDHLVRDVFRNFGKYLVDFFRMSKDVNLDYIRRNIRISNLETLKEIKAGGKGGIILTAHIGNWELGGVVLSHLGYSSLAIALPHKERPVNNLFDQQRQLHGINVVPMQLAIRKCLEAINNNQFVAVLADRNFTTSGEIFDFFGKKTLFPKGAAIFSLKTGAPIIPIFLIRENTSKFKLIVEKPIYPPAIMDKEIDQNTLLSLMRQYINVIEEKIRQHPTQWLMFRRFWIH